MLPRLFLILGFVCIAQSKTTPEDSLPRRTLHGLTNSLHSVVSSDDFGHERYKKVEEKPSKAHGVFPIVQEKYPLKLGISKRRDWAPVRSTIKPPISQNERRRWLLRQRRRKPRVHAQKTASQKKPLEWEKMIDFGEEGQMMISKTSDMDDLKTERKAAYMLADILKKEMRNWRKKALMKKIMDIKKDVDKLQLIKEKKGLQPSITVQKNPKPSTQTKLDKHKFTEMAIRKKLAEREEKIAINNGLTLGFGRKPLPKFTIGKPRKKKAEKPVRPKPAPLTELKLVNKDQVKVPVSPVIFEGTEFPSYLVEKSRNRSYMIYNNKIVDTTDMKKTAWQHRKPIRPPTLMPAVYAQQPRAKGSVLSKNIFLSESLLSHGNPADSHGLTSPTGSSHASHRGEIASNSITTFGNDIIDDQDIPPPYPFSHCYMNRDGFMCCNRYLESLMRKSYRNLKETKNFHQCSVQKIATKIQADCEQVFNTTFETVVGIDDFALRAHFAGDLMCKIIEDGKFITSYANTMPNRTGVAPDPLMVVTPLKMDVKEDEAVSRVSPPVWAQPNENGFQFGGGGKPFHELSRDEVRNENSIARKKSLL